MDQQRRGGCLTFASRFYAQMMCKMTHKQTFQRYLIGFLLSLDVLVVVMTYLVAMIWINRQNKKQYMNWDALTTTISDYTL